MKPSLITSLAFCLFSLQLQAASVSEDAPEMFAKYKEETRETLLRLAMQDVAKFSKAAHQVPSANEIKFMESVLTELKHGKSWDGANCYRFHPNEYFFSHPFEEVKDELLMAPRDYKSIFMRALDEKNLDIMFACIDLVSPDQLGLDSSNITGVENQLALFSVPGQQKLKEAGYNIEFVKRIKEALGLDISIMFDKGEQDPLSRLRAVIAKSPIKARIYGAMKKGEMDKLKKLIKLRLIQFIKISPTETDADALYRLVNGNKMTESTEDFLKELKAKEVLADDKQ